MKLVHEDLLAGTLTYELEPGRCVRLDQRAVELAGGAAIALHRMGLAPDPSSLPRRPVFQDGRMVGTLPGSFDPRAVRSGSVFYDSRPGDFVEDGEGWRAAPALGLGDLEAVEGFRPA